VIEHKNLGKGGPPVHFHLHQEEWFYVMEGEVLFQVGESRRQLRAGESLLGPRGIAHGFVGVGAKPAHMLIAFSPAGKHGGILPRGCSGQRAKRWMRHCSRSTTCSM
jgi:quercetin dioxygenase-like cupin family protein